MAQKQPLIVAEEDVADNEYNFEDVNLTSCDTFLVQVRNRLEEDYEDNVLKDQPEFEEKLTNFQQLLDRVVKRQANVTEYVPQVLHHLAKLIQVLSRHRAMLTELGFDIRSFNCELTDLFNKYKKRLANGVTTMSLFVTFLEITEAHWPIRSNYEHLNEDNHSSLTLSQKTEFLSILKGKIQSDIQAFNNIKDQAAMTKEIYNKKNIKQRLDELEKSVQQIPKLAKIFNTAILCLLGGAAVGGGGVPIFGAAGIILSTALPPVLVGIVVGGALAVLSAGVGTIVATVSHQNMQKRLQERIELLRTIFNVGNCLLDTITSGCDELLEAINNSDSLLLHSWISELSPQGLADELRSALKINLKVLTKSYSDTFDKISSYNAKVLKSNQSLEGHNIQALAIELKSPNPLAYYDAVNRPILQWQKDLEAPACNYCQKTFTLFRRRHHCRVCLKIYCRECCSLKIALGLPGVKGRVCPNCVPRKTEDVESLLQQMKESNGGDEDGFSQLMEKLN